MGQVQRTFLTTRWSIVAQAASSNDPSARQALELLCRSYWFPLYAYLRRLGRTAEDSADTVQSLFVDLIEKRRFSTVDPGRGRFRSWLLGALRFHLSHERERENSIRRGGSRRIVSLDTEEAESRWRIERSAGVDAERSFERAWALEVLERAMHRLEAQCKEKGKGALFAALRSSLVGGSRRSSLNRIAADLGMTEAAVKVAAHRLRRSFRDAIRAEVATTMQVGSDVDREIRSLLSALSA